jgi:hypothetical protein
MIAREEERMMERRYLHHFQITTKFNRSFKIHYSLKCFYTWKTALITSKHLEIHYQYLDTQKHLSTSNQKALIFYLLKQTHLASRIATTNKSITQSETTLAQYNLEAVL